MLSLDIYLERLPRDKCASCRKRRVLYRIAVLPCGEHLLPIIDAVMSVARCAECLGITR